MHLIVSSITKAFLKMVKSNLEHSFIKMVINILESLKIIKEAEKDNYSGQRIFRIGLGSS
jgi:hypothetical protein